MRKLIELFWKLVDRLPPPYEYSEEQANIGWYRIHSRAQGLTSNGKR